MPIPKPLQRINPKLRIVAAVVLAVVVIGVLLAIFLPRNANPLHTLTYKEVADLGQTQGDNQQYAALSGFAVGSHGYAVIANDNLSLYGTDGKLLWTVKSDPNNSFDKVDVADDGIAVLASTPPTSPGSLLGHEIIKYDYNGKASWQYQLPDNVTVSGINYWGGDSVDVAGEFTGSLTFGQDSINSVGGKDIVLFTVSKKGSGAPTAALNKQIGTSGDDTIGQYEHYTATQFVVTLGGSNAVIHAASTNTGFGGAPVSNEATLKSQPGTYVCDCATMINADTANYVYDWFRSMPNALQVTKGQNVGTVVLTDDNQLGTVQTSQDQNNNNDGSDQPQSPPQALLLQKIDSNGLLTDTKQVTEFNSVNGGNYNTIAATDNNLAFAVNNNGDTKVIIYGTNLDEQCEYTIKNLWPQQLYTYKKHIYLAGYLLPTTTPVTSSDMKIYQVY